LAFPALAIAFLSPGQSPILKQSPALYDGFPPAIIHVIRRDVSQRFMISAIVLILDELPGLLSQGVQFLPLEQFDPLLGMPRHLWWIGASRRGSFGCNRPSPPKVLHLACQLI